MTQVFTSSVIDAPLEVVWDRIRDFNGLPTWNPSVVESHIEEGLSSATVGCVRNFTLADGGKLREKLLALSDSPCSCTYSILSSPMPVEDYVATLRCLPITDGKRTYVEWSAEFRCPAEEEAGLVEGIGQGVFQASFDRLRELLEGR